MFFFQIALETIPLPILILFKNRRYLRGKNIKKFFMHIEAIETISALPKFLETI